ncbi:ABC transporter permease [Microbacterium sp. NC79]|uniref:ABC transporter permease n=1 Tax=Microbacterium sp. NC79 TaxID=2851009 RepID=UPI001C2C75B3|nr:ABC transporter permease [Microbacterium sp. NC79]
MIRYILTRSALLTGGLIVASLLIFLALRVLPGDVAQVIAGAEGTPEQVAQLREELGLNEPLPVQYFSWIGGVVTGDMGTSLITNTKVVDELLEKAEVTIPLGLMAMGVALVIAVPLGILSALRRNKMSGTALSVGAQGVAAVPVIWAGMVLILVFSLWLGWFRAQGFPRAGWEKPGDAFMALVLPAITIGIVEGAVLMRFVRSATLDAVTRDFVRTAAAKGLTRTQALLRHGLPSVGLSIITVLGLQVAGIVVGAVVIEKLFNLPGIGRMLIDDVGARDLPLVQGELLVLTAVVLLIGFAVDIVHRILDPRLREASE